MIGPTLLSVLFFFLMIERLKSQLEDTFEFPNSIYKVLLRFLTLLKAKSSKVHEKSRSYSESRKYQEELTINQESLLFIFLCYFWNN